MKFDRIPWIDVCRGIAILLVIYGHALSSDSYRHLIYAFHIPLFFYLSGIVHHYKKSESFMHMLRKSIKRNLLPYFFFAIITYLAALTLSTNIATESVLLQLHGILYGNGNNNYLSFNVALWFLPCLFITKIGFFLIEQISNTKKFIVLMLLIMSITGYLFSIVFPTIHLPFGAEAALTGIVFFGLGYLTELKREEVTMFIKKYKLFILIISLGICITVATINFNIYDYQIDLRLNRLGNYFLFYIGALSGILSSITLSIIINKNAILEYLGKNSLILYVWHTIIFVYFNKYIKFFMTSKEISAIRNLYLAPLYTTTASAIILFMNEIYQKYGKVRKVS